MGINTKLYGRRLLTRELNETELSFRTIPYKKIPAIVLEKNWLICGRCGTRNRKKNSRLTESLYYCTHCLFLGRCDSSQQLHLFSQPSLPKRSIEFAWTGQLTFLQKTISDAIVNSSPRKHHLIWAITGAGKTEMLYKVVEKTLELGGRVVLSSPRVDVCNELFLRFDKAFPEENILLLHGKTKVPYRFSPFVICTTHQLYRFYQAFDLVVIDEVDAFPYADDQGLSFAVQTAIKPTGRFIYLSATPAERLLKEIRMEFQIHRLPLRFHQRPLPKPKLFFFNDWQKKCLVGKRMRPLIRRLEQLLTQNHVLLFCPSIETMERLTQLLMEKMPGYRIANASARDPDRIAKVGEMRERKYDILLTTMILERGVTFEKVSIIVLGADHRVFTKSSLVQIAGRADRKGAYSNSEVYFFYDEKTTAMIQACHEIKEMNKQGKRLRGQK